MEQNKIYRDKTRKKIKIESGKTFSQPQGSNFCYLVSTINHIASLEDKFLLKKINNRFKIDNDQITFTFDNPGIQELKENGIIRTVGKAPYKEAISIKFNDFSRLGLDPDHANFPVNALIEMWKKFCVKNPHLDSNLIKTDTLSGAVQYNDQFYSVKGFCEKIGLEVSSPVVKDEASALVHVLENLSENQENSQNNIQIILDSKKDLTPEIRKTLEKISRNEDLSENEQSFIAELLTNGSFSEEEIGLILNSVSSSNDKSRQEQLSAINLPLPPKEGSYIVLRNSHYVSCTVNKDAAGNMIVQKIDSLKPSQENTSIIPYADYSMYNNDIIVIKEKTQAIS